MGGKYASADTSRMARDLVPASNIGVNANINRWAQPIIFAISRSAASSPPSDTPPISRNGILVYLNKLARGLESAVRARQTEGKGIVGVTHLVEGDLCWQRRGREGTIHVRVVGLVCDEATAFVARKTREGDHRRHQATVSDTYDVIQEQLGGLWNNGGCCTLAHLLSWLAQDENAANTLYWTLCVFVSGTISPHVTSR